MMVFEELFERFRRRMKELVEEFEKEIEEFESMWTPDGQLEPLITVEKYPDRYEIIIDLPFADLSSLTVKIINHKLLIDCELKKEIQFHRWAAYREVKFRKYQTTITLPPDADVSGIDIVKDENKGIVRVIIPRKR